MRKRRFVWIGVAAATVITAVLVMTIRADLAREEADEAAARAREAERRASRAEQRREQLRDESAGLIPPELGGVALGMSRTEVQGRRAGLRPKLGASELGLELWEERLSNGAEVVYGFGEGETGLAQIQVLSALPSTEAIAQHFGAMVDRYGPPTGIWDCPDTGGVPTRRFTWRKSRTTIADVFLLYGDRASVTLYIAPSEAIGASLQRSRCQPVRDRAQLEVFPTTTLEQIRRSQQAGGAAP